LFLTLDINSTFGYIYSGITGSSRFAGVAQLVEQLTCNQQVVRSGFTYTPQASHKAKN
jgi:hypothetical protein